MDLLNVQLLVLISCGLKGTQATLVSNVSVACPGDVVTFTCTVTDVRLQWTVTPPPGSGYIVVMSNVFSGVNLNDPLIVGNDPRFQFERTRIEASQGQLSSTLSTLSSKAISTYNESTVNCGSDELNIQVAAPPNPPQDLVLTFQNQTSVSVATLQWSPPTYTGDVDVNYVLTISSPTSPESSNTTNSSSIEITVTYNIEYIITIRADNCVGSSQDVLMVFKLAACPSSPSTANGVILTNTPSVTTEGSTLTITCSNNNDIVPSTCGSDGRWSPDPGDYDCVLPTPVTCPSSPSTANGVILTNIPSVTTEGSTLTITCSNNNDIVPSTCGTDGRWSPDPGDYDCVLPTTAPPIECGPPLSPVNGSVNLMSQSVPYAEGSVLTFQCSDGLFPTDPMITTCTDMSGMGEWNPNPADLVCRANPGEGPSTVPLATGEAVGISIVVTFVISVVIGLVVGVLVTYFIMNRKMKELTERQSPSQQPPVPAGPVYEEVTLPKENIELESNQAYGPVGQ